MLKGAGISLRPVAESDLNDLHARSLDLEARGPWYSLPQSSLTQFRAAFEENGFWSAEEGMFLVVDESDQTLGVVGWDTLNGSAPDVEVSYRLLSPEHAGKGTATEAVRLLASWLFGSQHMNRLMLYIHVDNIGSRRVAEKNGFTKEGTARQAWYHQGSWQDVHVYAMTRSDFNGLD